MENQNPYQVPKSAASHNFLHGITVENKGIVFIPVDADLPPRCVQCNKEVHTPIKPRKFYWHAPWYYLLILVSVLIYIIVAVIVRKKSEISIGRCPEHEKEHKKQQLLKFLGALAIIIVAIFLIIVAATFDSPIIIGLLVGAVILGLVFLLRMGSSVIKVVNIKPEGTRLKGFGEAFLASLR